MKAFPLFLLTLAFSTLACSRHGTAEDHSQFVDAALLEDGKTCLFTYHRFVYRPAVGLAAWPDGGVPEYLEDKQFVATVDLDTKEIQILLSEENHFWVDGHGSISIHETLGGKAILIQGGQRQSDGLPETKRFFLDVRTGEKSPLPLEWYLAREGRGLGFFYLLKPDGTILHKCPSFEEREKHTFWYRKKEVVPQLWLQSPDGSMRKIASTEHFLGFLNDEVHFWMPEDRSYKIFHIVSGEIRDGGKVDYSLFKKPDPVKSVRLSSGKKDLELGSKEGELWSYRKISVDLSKMK